MKENRDPARHCCHQELWLSGWIGAIALDSDFCRKGGWSKQSARGSGIAIPLQCMELLMQVEHEPETPRRVVEEVQPGTGPASGVAIANTRRKGGLRRRIPDHYSQNDSPGTALLLTT